MNYGSLEIYPEYHVTANILYVIHQAGCPWTEANLATPNGKGLFRSISADGCYTRLATRIQIYPKLIRQISVSFQ